MDKSLEPNYTPAIKLLNYQNDDCTFQYGKLPNNTIFQTTGFWLQKRTKEFEHKLHPAPAIQYVITLKGKLRFTVTDGSQFIIEPGIIIVATDIKGKGHSWEMLEGEVWERIYIPIPTGNEDYLLPIDSNFLSTPYYITVYQSKFMQQYLITAFDFTDDEAFERRLKVRPNHLVGAKKLKENGNFIIGGAMLNKEGKMIGSTMILQFETTAEFEAWKENEPYLTQKIWDKVEIKPFKVAAV